MDDRPQSRDGASQASGESPLPAEELREANGNGHAANGLANGTHRDRRRGWFLNEAKTANLDVWMHGCEWPNVCMEEVQRWSLILICRTATAEL